MIYKKDLQEGNIVHSVLNTTEGELLKEFVIDCLHRNTAANVDNETWGYTSLRGIKLTEDVLMRCGFEFDNVINWELKFRRKTLRLCLLTDYCTLSMSEFNVRLEFLHELQNFVYWLTRENLTYLK